nr:putative scaffold protein [Achromobacter phage vB_Ade_ART]
MALKHTVETLDGLPADVAKEYVEKDGKFVLAIEGDDRDNQIAHLTQKKSIAEEHRTKAEAKNRELQDKLDEMHRGAIPKGDVEALEASWSGKLTEATTKAKDRETKLLNQVHSLTIGHTASKIATEISTAPELMRPEIEKRLQVEETEDGRAIVRVKDAAGKPSAMTLDDLKAEIKADARFAPVIIGGKASGGGANGAHNGGIPNGKSPSEMTEGERIELYKRDPEAFARAFGQS